MSLLRLFRFGRRPMDRWLPEFRVIYNEQLAAGNPDVVAYQQELDATWHPTLRTKTGRRIRLQRSPSPSPPRELPPPMPRLNSRLEFETADLSSPLRPESYRSVSSLPARHGLTNDNLDTAATSIQHLNHTVLCWLPPHSLSLSNPPVLSVLICSSSLNNNTHRRFSLSDTYGKRLS